jgi:delta(3,5)-delta(2,4)-dienoyl-CoA isomerase
MFSTSASTAGSSFETLKVTVPKPFVYQVELNRPKQLNAMNKTMWM